MALGPVSEQILHEIDAVTGLPVQVDVDDRLPPPLLARIQFAWGGDPLHRASFHHNAGAIDESKRSARFWVRSPTREVAIITSVLSGR